MKKRPKPPAKLDATMAATIAFLHEQVCKGLMISLAPVKPAPVQHKPAARPNARKQYKHLTAKVQDPA
jgi:hypothetical protein